MTAPPHPLQPERLAALRALDILDTPRESEFDEIVALASRICDVPMSLISLVDEDRQWFKAEVGLGANETPIGQSICAHAILEPGLTLIPDTLLDPRAANNPLCYGSPNLRFYAGAPLTTDDGLPIGTLCVLDDKPRELNELQIFALEVLAKQVMTQIMFRKMAAEERAARQRADEKVVALEEAVRLNDLLMREVDHRVKNSLNIVASMLNLQSKTAASTEGSAHLEAARDRVLAISAVHDHLHVAAHYDTVDLSVFVKRLATPMQQGLPENIKLRQDVEPILLPTQTAGSIAIIINELVTNALKHAFPDGRGGTVGIDCRAVDGHLHLDVWDTGIGFDPDQLTMSNTLGMRVIRSLAGQLQGEVEQSDNMPGARTRIIWPGTAATPQ